jgi:hypothetical protein
MSVQTYKTTNQFIKELKSFDNTKINQLSAAWPAAWPAAWREALSAAWSEDWFADWAEDWFADWSEARSAARSAHLAVLVKDKITAEQFEILTSPWTSCGLSLFVEAEEVETHTQGASK